MDGPNLCLVSILVVAIIAIILQFRLIQKRQHGWRAFAKRMGLLYQVGALSGTQISGMYRGRYITIKGVKGRSSEYHSDPDLTLISVTLKRKPTASASQDAMVLHGGHNVRVVGQALELKYNYLVISEDTLLSLLDQVCELADSIEILNTV
jgi:hypothetical protein